MDKRKLKSTLRKLDSINSENPSKTLKRKRSVSPESDEDLFPSSPQLTQRTCSKRREERLSIPKSNKFQEFVKKIGITLNPNNPPAMNEERQVMETKINQLINNNDYTTEEIVNIFEEYIKEPNNIRNLLLPMELVADEIYIKISLVRVFLSIPKLQSQIRQILLYKLSESTILATSPDQVSWLNLLLTELSFLEITVEADTFSTILDEILIAGPTWFQKKLIECLPDITTDTQHHSIVETLDKLMTDNADLTGCILDCIKQFNLGKELILEYQDRVLTLLKNDRTLQTIPAIILFILGNNPTYEMCKKISLILREIKMHAYFGDNIDECKTNQKKIINALTATMRSKEVVKAMLDVVKMTNHEPSPVDIIYILLIYLHKSSQRKLIENIVKIHVKSGFYRASLLKTFYKDYKEVARDLQVAALPLAGNLLTIDNCVYVNFAIDWLGYQFNSQKNVSYKQREILEFSLTLMGKNDQTANNVLCFLRKISTNDKCTLQSHTNLLRLLLDKMHQLDLEQVGILNDLLYSLCIEDGTGGNQLYDELMILQQKQLHSAKSVTKSRGVMATTMAIKHLAMSDTSDIAINLFDKVLTTVKSCPRSQALFYDELGKIIMDSPNINERFVDHVQQRLVKDFQDIYLEEWIKYKDGEMVPKYGLNEDHNGQPSALNFKDGKYGALLPIAFKLLTNCLKEDNFEDMDPLLEVPILMPRDFDMPDSKELDHMVCCVNWFREIISGFVMRKDSLLKKKVLQRLDNLMELQGELSEALAFCETNYQPPPCYFHYITPSSLIKIDKKLGKKSKKKEIHSAKNCESSAWEMGSIMCLKNPAYFRRLNTKVVHLLQNDLQQTQTSSQEISIIQVCFLVKEVLGMFDNDPTEMFIRDLIDLLPKIMGKLQHIVEQLREEDGTQNREAVKLLLDLLNAIFNWKGFQSATHHGLLQDGLKTLSNIQTKLRSNRELVSESYKYFESITDVATRLSIAHSLVNVCQTLMQHSKTFAQENKEKQAHLAYGFLCLAWSEEQHTGSSWTTPLNGLLNSWIENEPSPLSRVSEILEWLPDEMMKLEKSNDHLGRIPTINRRTFNLLLKRLFQGMISGLKISLSTAETDPDRIEVWKHVTNNIKTVVKMCKLLAVKPNIVLYARYVPVLLKTFLLNAMPVLECNLKYQTEDITGLLKTLQSGTRYLHYICTHYTLKKDVTLLKLIPTAKSILEKFIYRVKGMLVMNDVSPAFWMGNLLNKNLEGVEVQSQASLEGTSTTSDLDLATTPDNESEVLDDPGEDLSITSEEDEDNES